MGLDMRDQRAPYLQVADALRTAVRAGTFTSGDRLPTVAELAKQHSVAKMTVHRALAILRDEGLVITWQGRGTYVREQFTDRDEISKDDSGYKALLRQLDRMREDLRRLEGRIAQLETDQADDPHQSGL